MMARSALCRNDDGNEDSSTGELSVGRDKVKGISADAVVQE